MEKIEIKKGDKYGILTILKEDKSNFDSRKRNMRMVSCLCDCGTEIKTYFTNLRTGHTTSCGCVRTERIVKFNKGEGHYKKHGMWNSPEYKSWNMMKQRCQNPNNKKYYLYGARGIKVYEQWNDFINFYKDMGKRPKGTSIDRIDSKKNYEPENCKWATIFEQNNHLSKRSGKNNEMTLLYRFKKEVKRRDNDKCRINNKDCEGKVVVHHILNWKDYPKLRYDVNNGITLCQAHHPRKRKDEAKLSPYFQELVAEKN